MDSQFSAQGSTEKKFGADYEQLFSCFPRQKIYIFLDIVAPALKSCTISLLYKKNDLKKKVWSKQATPHDLNSECKSKENLRRVLFYLFCDIIYLLKLVHTAKTKIYYIFVNLILCFSRNILNRHQDDSLIKGSCSINITFVFIVQYDVDMTFSIFRSVLLVEFMCAL